MNKLNKADLIWIKQNEIMLPTTEIKGVITLKELEHAKKGYDFSKQGLILVREQNNSLEKAIVGKTFEQLIAESSLWDDVNELKIIEVPFAKGVMIYSLLENGRTNICNSLLYKLDNVRGKTNIENSYIQEMKAHRGEIKNVFTENVEIREWSSFENVRGLKLSASSENIKHAYFDENTHFRSYSTSAEVIPICEIFKDRYKAISDELLREK